MKNYDVLIIGGGAAGLSAAIYAARSGMKTLVLDEAGGGGQISQIDILENYPGIFPAVKGTEFIDNLKEQAKAFNVEFSSDSVKSIDKKQTFFYINTYSESFEGKSLIIATGADHKKLDVPGEKEFSGKGVSYCAVCDGPFFRNKKVVVVGGGDSACTEAIYLSNLAKEVHIIHRRNKLRAADFIVEKIKSNDKITVHYDSTIDSINGRNFVESVNLINTVNGKSEIFETDGVFIFTGMNPRAELLEIIPKDEKGYIRTDEKMRTVIPGLFAAGDVRSKPLRQIVTAASDGAIAGFMAAEFVKG